MKKYIEIRKNEYYDSVTGEMGHMTQSELETKTTGKFYILDHK